MSIIGIIFWIVFLIAAFCQVFGLGPAYLSVLFIFIELALLGIGQFNGTLFVRTPPKA